MSSGLENHEDFIKERLVEGEKVVARAVIHPAIFWQAGAVLVVGILFGLMVAKQLGILLIVVAGLMAMYAQARRMVYMLVLTDKRVLVRYGLLQMDVVDIRFDKIESVELERMPPGMAFGYSNVVVMGTGNRYIVIPYVANGPQIRKAYNEMVLNDED
ncbi:MAG: PH domain-containing protein [Alphaproteobacteria bacterium]|nr:PH domain-containing protein [Alphaproteobacteria bacterium]